MAGSSKPPRAVSGLVLAVMAIGLAVLALIAALVWRPLVSSLHLDPAPVPARTGHALAADAQSVSAAAARAP